MTVRAVTAARPGSPWGSPGEAAMNRGGSPLSRMASGGANPGAPASSTRAATAMISAGVR